METRKLATIFMIVAFVMGSFLILINERDRVVWHARQIFVVALHTIYPELEVVPTPAAIGTLSPLALTPVVVNPASAALGTPVASAINAAPAAAPTPIPGNVQLTGVVHVWQKLNNCGPATLTMALSYWGWKGTQANTATALKPDPNDRNVSPQEMAAYARTVGLEAVVRVGGTVPLIKQFVAAGFPVILEKGITLTDAGWEGHFTLVTGYSDTTGNVTTQDSLQGPDFQVPDHIIPDSWRAFDYLYIVLFPRERQAEVMALLGPDADAQTNYVRAANIARQEVATLSGQPLAFAWFNLGTNLIATGHAADAASAFDQARLAQLPWRMLWYQTGPFEAYYAAKRYGDVSVLADAALTQANNLEEAYYWRGKARLAEDDQDGAVVDWRTALRYNRYYQAPSQALADLGLTP